MTREQMVERRVADRKKRVARSEPNAPGIDLAQAAGVRRRTVRKWQACNGSRIAVRDRMRIEAVAQL
jgi:hypothetical protein